MDVRRRPPKATRLAAPPTRHHQLQQSSPSDSSAPPKASDALPLPLYLTNAVFFTLFFSVAYYLLLRWRDKIRNSMPLHLVTFSELAAILTLIASFIYLLGFFGIDFVQSFIARASNDAWDIEDDVNLDVDAPQHPLLTSTPDPLIPAISSEGDDEIVEAVVNETIPSHKLEVRLGDCKRAVRIRREALQRITGRSLQGLPLDGFDYNSILKQCCEEPVGYVQIPVGIAGPLLLDGFEYSVPMATTEGCLVASTNRGCKALYASGGATSTILRDGMTRAPVVSFPSATRACQLKFFLEDPSNFQ